MFFIRNRQWQNVGRWWWRNGILVQLENINFDANELSHMFITHNHTDHILGCVWIIRCIAHNINENKYFKEFCIYGAEEVIKI